MEGVKDWRKFRPWVFAIEATLPTTDIPCHDKWEDLLLANDYVFAYQLAINRYYVDVEREHLLANFAMIEQFVAQNEIVQLRMSPVVFN